MSVFRVVDICNRQLSTYLSSAGLKMQSPLHFLNRPEIDFLPYTQSTSGIVISLSNMRRAIVMKTTID